MKSTLIIGTSYVELEAHVKSLPKGNEDVESEYTETKVSGSGWKSAWTMQKIGFPYELLSPCGTGVYGDYVREQAKKNGIRLSCGSEETNGCVYSMIDPKGTRSTFCVPGAEYDFSLDYVQDLDPDQVECTMLFADMLNGYGAEDIVSLLEDLDKPVYFSCGHGEELPDSEVMDVLVQFHPVLYLTDTDAYYLSGEEGKDLSETAYLLHRMTDAPVVILKDGEGCYYCDADEKFIAPHKKPMDPQLHMAMYICGRNAGIDLRNNLMNANRFSAEYFGRLPDDREAEYEKHKLAGFITLK